MQVRLMGWVRFWLILLANLIFGFASKAEWKLAIINDVDGFTNVRSGRGVSFKITTTIKANELFYCIPSSSDWWKINTNHNGEGYIHKSHIKIVETFPASSKRTLLFHVFNRQKDLANEFKKAAGKKDRAAFRTTAKKLEEHSEYTYDPLLKIFTAYFCKTSDTLLLKHLFITMWADKGSADETPPSALGDVFVCKPDFVAKILMQLSKEQRAFIADNIEFGLLNHYQINDGEKPENKEYIQLKKKLETIRR